MSSKFFTWTKGDRRNAEVLRSNGIVPIPAECISIKGMDYARTTRGSTKANRRPTPLSLEGSPEPPSKHSSRTNDSIALHDAAVQSATSLMAVMNDMLRSPPLSAHLFAQNHPDTLSPLNGRPRSRTVPSTPLVEAPSSIMGQPVELPGSFPLEKKPSMAHYSVDGKRQGYVFCQSPANASLGATIARPHSSPQEATYPIPCEPGAPKNSPRSRLLSASQVSPRSKSASPLRQLGVSLSNDSGEDTLVATDSSVPKLATIRPTLFNLSDDTLNSASLPPSQTTSRAASSNVVPRFGSFQDGHITLDQVQQVDSEAVLMEQISNLRASHDAHVRSLKESHEKEIASHRSYISFLESRRGLPVTSDAEGKHALTIDTSHSSARCGELLSSDASATTLQSFESSLENQKRASQETTQGVEALKRKLSLCRKARADAVDIRRERDHLRESLSRSDRRILQLKDIVRKAKDNEKALKNATTDLEARLILANNEKTDVLEGYHEACVQIEDLSNKERHLTQELADARSLNRQSETVHGSAALSMPAANGPDFSIRHDAANSETGAAVAKNYDSLLQQVRDLRRQLTNKDAHIRRLEEVLSVETDDRKLAATRSVPTQSSWLSELQNSLEEQRRMLATAQADSERYNSLLHNELCRQSRSAAEKPRPATPKIEAEAFVLATEKMLRLKAQSRTSTDGGLQPDGYSEPLATLLEREVEHCIKEIVMYKSDLKIYKKDLRRAQIKIESMQSLGLERLPTPDGESAASGRSNASPPMPRSTPFQTPQPPMASADTPDSGLGISLPGSQYTPTKNVTASATSAMLSPTSGPKSTALQSPNARPKTPLSTHKKLPKPPPSPNLRPLPATPPPSTIKLQRNETVRSLSESIISSYTKRGSSEQEPDSSPPSRDRSSAPLQSIQSPMAPVSRFATPRQTPTPPPGGKY